MRTDVAAVIVTYYSAGPIEECLRSLRGVTEVVVVDNGSKDKTCEIVRRTAPEATLIVNSSNRGFAGAVNQGIAATTSPLVLLLNPDSYLRTPLDAMVEDCLRTRVGAVGGKLVDANGESQRGFNVRALPTAAALAAECLGLNRMWPSNRVNRRYRRFDLDPNKTQEVEQPAGAFLMVRRDVLEIIDRLDEGFYPLWFEDVDLCWRILRAGYKIRYTPQCQAAHDGGHSVPAMTAEQRQLAWYGNLIRFIDKHFSNWTGRWLRPVILVGILGRWLASWGAGNREERKAYAKALRLVVGGRRLALPAADGSVGASSAVQF
jgi:GT2 family glycosyltransferase